MTVIRAKQRSHAGQLSDYLTRDPTAELGQVRGVVATSAHEAIAELSLLAAGTKCTAELFHCSINPNPADAPWTDAQYQRAWDVFEQEHGLEAHAYAEVWHRDDGRLHAHRVYAVVADGRATKLSWSRITNEKIGRRLEHEFGHQFVPGPNQARVLQWLERSRDPQQQRAAAAMRAAGLNEGPERPPSEKEWEKDQAERTAVAVAEIERAAAEAWRAASGDGALFVAELKTRNIFLARGEKGPVLVDWAEGVHPAGRRLFAGLTKGEPGREKTHQAQGDTIFVACPPGNLPTVEQARAHARRAMAPVSAPEVLASPVEVRSSREIDRLILSAWRETSTNVEFRAQLVGAGMTLRLSEDGHWIVDDRADPQGRPHDVVRSLLAAWKAEGIKRKTADVRPEVIQRLAGLALPNADSMRQQHGEENGKERAGKQGAGREEAAQKSDSRTDRREPPPGARNRLRDLSELELVPVGTGTPVLLPGNVRDRLEVLGAGHDQPLRRELEIREGDMGQMISPIVRAAANEWIAGKNRGQTDDSVADALWSTANGNADVLRAAGLTDADIAECEAITARPNEEFATLDDARDAAEQAETMEDHAVRAASLRDRANEMILNGDQDAENQPEVIELFRQAAELGDGDALYAMGRYYLDGAPGIEPDEIEALRLITLAAEMGNDEAQIDLEGFRRDEDRHTISTAKTVADLLAVRDPVLRFDALDRASRLPQLSEEDRATAEAHRLAAAKEIMASSRLRERARQEGIGERVYSLAPREENRTADEARERAFDYKAQQDHEYAIRFFREAAAAGDAESSYELGLYHELGVEVAQDFAEAARLYQAAADGGFPEAVNALDALEKKRPQEQTAQQAEEPVRLAKRRHEPAPDRSVKEAERPAQQQGEDWKAKKAFEQLDALPPARLAVIAAGEDRGKDYKLWTWRWNHVTAQHKQELERKIATARQEHSKARQQEPRQVSAREKDRGVEQPQEMGATAQRGAPEMWPADRAAAYRQLVGERARVVVHDNEVHVTLPSGRQIRDTGNAITTDREGDRATARMMMQMVQARGWREASLIGTKPFKLELARAAVELGIMVKNAELAGDVARFKKELEATAHMRPADRVQELAEAPAHGRRAVRNVDQIQPPAQETASTVHERIEQYAGRALDQALTRGVEDAVVETGIDIVFGGGARLSHTAEAGAELQGPLTAERAQLMAELMIGHGESAVTLTGSAHAKEVMCRAAVRVGLDVSNPELRHLVDQLKKEQTQTRERQAHVAAMRPDRPAQERQPQHREQSAAALAEMELARLRRELAVATSAVERMRAADRLARATQDQAIRQHAEDVRLEAARQVLAEGHHDEMAEELVGEAIQGSHQAEVQER